MRTFVIGDVQGCFDILLQLLDHIDFQPEKDTLWFTGDLFNRGPAPLETLRWLRSLRNAIYVMGNHDLALLGALSGVLTLPDDEPARVLLSLPEREEIVDWLRQWPLLHHDLTSNTVLTHAGIYPLWTLSDAIQYAREAENVLRGPMYREFLSVMYGNQPDLWQTDLRGWDRIRFILNAFTRMRWLAPDGRLELTEKRQRSSRDDHCPWFEFPTLEPRKYTLLFGHWAALKGQCHVPQIYALDEGCVWGGHLCALCLETKQRFHIACQFPPLPLS